MRAIGPPIGTGPYQLVAFRPDDRLVLRRFDGYFEGPAKNPGVVLKVVPDDTMRGLELRKGRVVAVRYRAGGRDVEQECDAVIQRMYSLFLLVCVASAWRMLSRLAGALSILALSRDTVVARRAGEKGFIT